MLSQFLYYLVGILAVVGGVLLLERIVAGPHTTSGTGYARVDSAFDFDRLRGKQFSARATNLLGRHGRSTLPLLQDIPHVFRIVRDEGRLRQSPPFGQGAGTELIGAHGVIEDGFRGKEKTLTREE